MAKLKLPPVQEPQELYKVGDRVRMNSKANETYKVAHEGSEGVIISIGGLSLRVQQYHVRFDVITPKKAKLFPGLVETKPVWRVGSDCFYKIGEGEVEETHEDNELEGLVTSEQTQTEDKPKTEQVVKTYLL